MPIEKLNAWSLFDNQWQFQGKMENTPIKNEVTHVLE